MTALKEGPMDKQFHQDQVSYPIPPNLALTHTLTATLIHISITTPWGVGQHSQVEPPTFTNRCLSIHNREMIV
jgi:hypothetical protein